MRRLIAFVFIGLGFLTAYHGFSLLDESPCPAVFDLAIAAGWLFIAAMKISRKEKS
jgi:hypothetical protein